MADVKWIKITTTMFDDEKIKLIDAMPERDTIFYIWMRLLVQAGKTNAGGYIFLTENVPYTEEMLSTIFGRQTSSVRLALQTLKSFGMIEISENHLIKISNWEKHQNIEGMEKVREQNKLRKQNQRSKIKGLQEPTLEEITGTENTSHVMSRDGHAIEEEREEDIDKEKESIEKSFEICKFYESLSGGNSITTKVNDIKELIEIYTFDWVKDALERAYKQGKVNGGNPLAYTEGILKNWAKNGKEEKVKQVKKEETVANAGAYRVVN